MPIQQGHRCFVNIAPIVFIDAACEAFLFHPVQMQEIIVVLCLHNRVINDRIRNINPADQLRTACLMLLYGCHVNMHCIVHGYGGGCRGGCHRGGRRSRCFSSGCRGSGFRNNRKLCRRFYFYCRLTGIEKKNDCNRHQCQQDNEKWQPFSSLIISLHPDFFQSFPFQMLLLYTETSKLSRKKWEAIVKLPPIFS